MRRTLTMVLAMLMVLGLSLVPAEAAPPDFSRAAMTARERSMLPDALGEVTKAGEYMGVRVSPGDILLPAASPEKPTNASTEQMSRIPEGARVQTQGFSWRSLLSVFGARPAWAACGDVVVLHGTETDVYEYGIYDYRRLGAIGEDTCDKITAYYRARLVHIVNGNDVATYHINDQIRLRHEDWDTGGDGCDWVDDNGYNVGVGPCIGTINPDDIRGSQGDSPATYYIRHGAFHPKGAQDRWQTYGQYSYAWFPQYDIWSPTRMSHCSDMWRALSSITYSRNSAPSACDSWTW